MWICLLPAAVLLAAAGLYLLAIIPARRTVPFPYADVYIAHRGLFDNHSEAPENSLPAFRKAVEHGYGIELDVQLTKDKQLAVFHDDDLARMCRVDKDFCQLTFAELQELPLAASRATVPLFRDVLKLVDGKVPLIVEIKSDPFRKETTEAALRELEAYTGEYCIESFDPLIMGMVKKRRPDIVRGQLSTNYYKDLPEKSWFTKFLMTNLLLNFISRPDFIAFNHKFKNCFSYKLFRKIYGGIHVAWTIKSQEELEQAEDVFQCMIFDSFTPDPK